VYFLEAIPLSHLKSLDNNYGIVKSNFVHAFQSLDNNYGIIKSPILI
jgi:hypothetical protein